MNDLDILALEYGSDKSSKHHNYTKIYDGYFKNLKENILKILEIGVNKGASLKMWKSYFVNSKVYGIDIGPGCKQLEEDRIEIFIGDQQDTEFLSKVVSQTGKDIDIIIDDGSHYMPHQISSFNFLFPCLKSKGIYVIEDTNTSYWSLFAGGLKKKDTTIEFLKDRIDDLSFSGYEYKGTKVANPELILTANRTFNIYEKLIESIHFYCGIAIIIRR
jgi:hypothetical protein